METRICSLCNKEKDICDFYFNKTKNKYFTRCKECLRKLSLDRYNQNKEKKSLYHKNYYIKNKERLLKQSKDNYYNNIDEKKKKSLEYYYNNKEKRINYSKKYWREHFEELGSKQHQRYIENREKIIKRQSSYYKKHIEERKNYYKEYRKNEDNKIKIRDYYNKRKNDDKLFVIKNRIRHLIIVSIKKMGYTKKSKTYQILGCDYETIYNHLLKTYKDNYGIDYDFKEKVHIDHIIPIATAKNEEEVIKLNHYKNLQLLKANDNLEKGNKLNWKIRRKDYETKS